MRPAPKPPLPLHRRHFARATYSVAEAFRRPGDINDSFAKACLLYVSYGGIGALAAAIALLPGAPLVSILFLSQALNAVLLLLILPFMRRLAQDPA